MADDVAGSTAKPAPKVEIEAKGADALAKPGEGGGMTVIIVFVVLVAVIGAIWWFTREKPAVAQGAGKQGKAQA